MNKKPFILFVKYAAVTSNIIFILWILYNGGIDEGFKGTIYQKISTIGLLGLLALNIFLILTRKKETDRELISLLRYAAVCGNVLFIFWMLLNGINEGFKASFMEKIKYISMFGLLAINSIFLCSKVPKAKEQF